MILFQSNFLETKSYKNNLPNLQTASILIQDLFLFSNFTHIESFFTET
jgi:hypothetical protein